MAEGAAPRLDGKVALVTGASRGLGRAIAQRLAAAGAIPVVTARSLDQTVAEPGTLRETVALIEAVGGAAIPLAADLENAEDRATLVERAVEAAGGLDILVNNAGYAQYAGIAEMPDDVFDQTIGHYLRAPFALSRAAIPHMEARGAGWIVNVGSVTALPPLEPYSWFDIHGGSTLYAAAKSALDRFTQGLAAEVLERGIAVNMVAPSTAIKTPGSARHIPDDYPTEDVVYFAESALQLCHLPATARTGKLVYSMHFPGTEGFPVFSLDGTRRMAPPEIPETAHPGLLER